MTPTQKSRETAERPQSFQHFVSITERGFEPPALAVEPGETVRFTNNTGDDLELEVTDIASVRIPRSDYTEVTFPEPGEYSYVGKTKGMSGAVRVE